MVRILNTSVWVTLALCSGLALRTSGEQELCSTVCASIKADSSEACAKSKKSLPRPKIGRLCQDGFDEAFKLSCGELCSLHGTSRPVPSHLGKACDKRKREVPRPVAYKACVDGFNAGFAETATLVTNRIESMEEDVRKHLIDSNMSILKEADAERQVLDEAEQAKEADQAKRKKEELERAQKAVEERSAEVRREKEALSEKQALETAQAAEEAARNKKKAEEERQARIKAAIGKKEATKAARPDGSDASSLESSPALEQQAEHGVDDRDSARRKPPVQETSERLQEGAPAGVVEDPPRAVSEDKRTIELPNDPRYREVLRAEHVEGFGTRSSQEGGELPSKPLDAVESPTENASDAESEGQPIMKQPDDPRDREVLRAEHVEGFGSPSARRDGDLPHTTRERGEPFAENPSSGASNNGMIQLPNDPRFREVLTVEHVVGSEAQLGQQDGEPPRETPDAVEAATESLPDAESEGKPTTELSDVARDHETLTTKPSEDFGASLGQEDGKISRGTEDGAVDGAELGAIELPNDARHRDVLTPDHAEADDATEVSLPNETVTAGAAADLGDSHEEVLAAEHGYIA